MAVLPSSARVVVVLVRSSRIAVCEMKPSVPTVDGFRFSKERS
jgi:hypothetical protein